MSSFGDQFEERDEQFVAKFVAHGRLKSFETFCRSGNEKNFIIGRFLSTNSRILDHTFFSVSCDLLGCLEA